MCGIMATQTVVVFVQALEGEPQLLLMFLQVLGELIEVKSLILICVPRGNDFLQTKKANQKQYHQSDVYMEAAWIVTLLIRGRAKV